MTSAIVVAVYNGKKYLEKQLRSLLEQTHAADEVILCDDASTDGSAEFIENFIETHRLSDKWRLVRNEANLGYVRNFYRGIRLTSADVIFLSDQDDIWAADKIEKMIAVMSSNLDITVLSCDFCAIDENDQILKGLLLRKKRNTGSLSKVSIEDIMRACLWPGMTMALRREFALSVADLCDKIDVIHDFMISILAAEENSFYFYDYCGCYHRRHGGNAAAEEHRIGKLLNLERKLKEMRIYNSYLSAIIGGKLPLAHSLPSICAKYKYSIEREKAMRGRSLKSLLKAYRCYPNTRLRSFICDLWLICFGKYSLVCDIN